jgi:hypothetical protein
MVCSSEDSDDQHEPDIACDVQTVRWTKPDLRSFHVTLKTEERS